MFTGIIESLGTVQQIRDEGSNRHFTIASTISEELKIDQSISHNGACLTVVGRSAGTHVVTAVLETLNRTNLGSLKVGDAVNLERAMISNARLDGHMVQGHVDMKGVCTERHDQNGSWDFHFEYTSSPDHMLVDKGSICINGVSLTVNNPTASKFQVAIIPYTFEHTTFKNLMPGDEINLEFDIIGKYISRYAKLYFPQAVKLPQE